jgi:hypothetical protein
MQVLTESDIKKIMLLINKPINRVNIISIEDNRIKTLLDYYLFLTEHSDIIIEQLHIVSKEVIFYSRYYWFKKFKKEYFTKYGYDGDMDQQAFQILEEIDRYIDNEIVWEALEKIEEV